jgi:hypothetical protein
MGWVLRGADREAETHIRKDAVMPSLGSNTAGAAIGAPFHASSTQNNRANAPPQGAPSGPERAASPAIDSRLAALIDEHDDLDVAISVLLEAVKRDDLLITRLKKRKLQIKDEIALASPAAKFHRNCFATRLRLPRGGFNLEEGSAWKQRHR